MLDRALGRAVRRRVESGWPLDDLLSAEERLYQGKENEEQQAILKRMLDAHDKDTGEVNRVNAKWAIIRFCFPDDTGTRPNIDRPIEDAIGW